MWQLICQSAPTRPALQPKVLACSHNTSTSSSAFLTRRVAALYQADQCPQIWAVRPQVMHRWLALAAHTKAANVSPSLTREWLCVDEKQYAQWTTSTQWLSVSSASRLEPQVLRGARPRTFSQLLYQEQQQPTPCPPLGHTDCLVDYKL